MPLREITVDVPGQTKWRQDDDHEDQQEKTLVHRHLILTRSETWNEPIPWEHALHIFLQHISKKAHIKKKNTKRKKQHNKFMN